MGLEKKRAKNGTIDSLVVEDDKEVKNYKEVLDEIKKFYQNLFLKQELNETDTQFFLESLNLPKISDSDKIMCDNEIIR